MPRMPRAVRTDMVVTRDALPETFRPGGVTEVAAVLGVSTSQVTTWISRRETNGCPPPMWDSRMGTTYNLDDWLQWRDTLRHFESEHYHALTAGSPSKP
jgi:hypothetical protein